MNDLETYWSELVDCTLEGCGPHDRMTYHSLGMNCGRCQKHTGNNHQGHYWGLCKALLARGVDWKNAVVEFHFCCPDDCELGN